MEITRKGYYTIDGPDGLALVKPDGNTRQVTSRDECYEYITEDGREGVFTIHCPDREVEVSLMMQGGVPGGGGGGQTFGPPMLYDQFVPYIITMGDSVNSNLASGSADVMAAEYGENNDNTVFYSAYDNLMHYQDWGTRTGNAVSVTEAGLQKALEVQIVRWAGGNAGAWHRAADVPYTAIQKGETKNWIAGNPLVDSDDFYEHLYGADSGANFNRSYLSEYGAGVQSGTQAGRDIGNTGSNFSRACAYLGYAAVLWEKLGNPRAVDPFDGAANDADKLTVDWCYRGSINHLHMWMSEFTNLQTTQGVLSDYADSTALFQTTLSVHFLYEAYKWFESQSEDPDQYFPATILDGDYLGDPPGTFQPTTSTAGLYAGTRDILGQFMDFVFSPIDGVPTIDTTPYSQTNRYTGGYCRVNEEHTIPAGEINAGTYSVGDPMVFRDTDGYITTYHRSNGVGTSQWFNRNIQMMNVLGLYEVADLYDGIDNERRDKYIRWGDEVFAGAVQYGQPSRQKAKNQQMYYVFEALLLRNALRGRND